MRLKLIKQDLTVWLATLMAGAANGAWAATPPELPQVTATRTASTVGDYGVHLSKNVFRYETREEQYEVQVPYIVQVPYLEWETYYVTERHCEWVQGKEVCRYVQVPYQRQVTRYRDETRYRTETRTRLVTIQLFERQWGVRVKVVFPDGSQPMGSETETLTLALTGTEAKPDADLSIESQVFNYRVVERVLEAGLLTIRLETVAKYAHDDLGAKTITGFSVQPIFNQKGNELRFEDRGAKPRAQTRYEIAVKDLVSGEVLYSGAASATLGQPQVRVPMPESVVRTRDLALELKVARAGVSIEGGSMAFVVRQTQLGLIDSAPFTDPRKVEGFSISGEGLSASVSFFDHSPVHADVRTFYSLALYRGSQRFVYAGNLERSAFADAPGAVEIPLSRLTGLDERDIVASVRKGARVGIEIRVWRSSQRLGEQSPVNFLKAASVTVK